MQPMTQHVRAVYLANAGILVGTPEQFLPDMDIAPMTPDGTPTGDICVLGFIVNNGDGDVQTAHLFVLDGEMQDYVREALARHKIGGSIALPTDADVRKLNGSA